MKKIIFAILTVVISFATYAQIGINNDGSLPNPSAMLDVKSDTAGVLIPRMTAVQRDAINNPAQGLLVFVTDDNTFYYFDSNSWQPIGSGSSSPSFWDLNGTTVSPDSLYSVAIGTENTTGSFEVSTQVANGSYTADQCTGGTVTAQEHQGAYVPANLFDDNTGSLWRNNNNLPVWIQYDFGAGNEKRIQKYRLYWDGAQFEMTPYSWELLGSNDGTTWTTLDSQTGQDNWTSGEWREYTFSNSQSYQIYRLNITDNNGAGSTAVYLDEMEMMEAVYSAYPALFVSGDNVGVGTQSPTANLEVDGTFRYVDGNEAAGKILSSDASGNAIWVKSDTLNAGGWTISGDTVYNMSSRIEISGHVYQNGLGYSTFFGVGAGENDDLYNGQNTAIGYAALKDNISSMDNTAIGYASLSHTTSGQNTAVGVQSLEQNTTGRFNTAIGEKASWFNESGNSNTAIGNDALLNNHWGDNNTGVGFSALSFNFGHDNTAIGAYAGTFLADGTSSNTSPDNSTFIGTNTKAKSNNDSNEIVIGYDAIGLGSNSVVIGDTNIVKTALRGNVGVGTENPKASLEVAGPNGFLVTGIISTGNSIDSVVTGGGTRMFFNPFKAAFRAGHVNTDQWDNANIGLMSVAFGNSTKASGANSTSLGSFSEATANFATSIGVNTIASGTEAMALGSLTTASGDNSTSMGYSTTASGEKSMAAGEGTEAFSYRETVVGSFNTDYSPLGTISWQSPDRLFVVGNGEDASNKSDALIVYKSGNTELHKKLTAPLSGNADLKAYIYGSLKDTDGSFYAGESTSGFTSTKVSTGVYKITFSSYNSDKAYLVFANALQTTAPVVLTYEKDFGFFTIRAWDLSGSLVDTYLNFVVYKK